MFLDFFMCTFFFHFYFGYSNILNFFLSTVIVHNLTFSFVVVDLSTK